MVTGIFVPSDGEAKLELQEFEKLSDYQVAVGGYIQPVEINALGVTVYVNEEGLVRRLPLNSRVTFLWWFHAPEARQRAMLVGNAVIIGPTDSNGDNTSVPPEVVDLLMDTRVYRVEVQVIGGADWHRNQTTYTDYWEALIWAMLLLERWALATDVRVVPVLDDNMLPLFRGDVP